jgi:uncharacterized protein (DUF1800 family)
MRHTANSVHRRHLLRAAMLGSTVLIIGAAPLADARPRTRERPALVRRDALPEDTARALHLLERATFGATRQGLAEVLRTGPEAWLDRQLRPERIDDAVLAARLAPFPAAEMPPAALYAAYPPPDPQQRRARAEAQRADSARMQMAGEEMAADASPDARRRRGGGDGTPGPQRILFDIANAKLQRAVYSPRQLEEVMTDFWFNHFNVFFGKNQDRYLVGAYEREAIRPHVFGRFRDLLEATARHPAMLVYLDNWQSAAADSSNATVDRVAEARRRWRALAPEQRRRAMDSGRVTAERAAMLEADDSTAARRMRRPRGVNENYARELMELHTLGVDGGYSQRDVMEVARAFTGWTLDTPLRRRGGEGGDVGFAFRPGMHDRGEKTVLGKRLPSGRGVEDGEAVLDLLARHPSTARHVALKLAQRFVADEPPASLVDRLADVFTRTDGDLRAVTRALFVSPEFNDPRYRDAKVKTPFEFVASALRATGAEAGPSRGVMQALRQFGHVPYAAQAPTGYPHTSEEWTNGGAMLNRMNFGLALAAGRIDGVRIATRDAVSGAPSSPSTEARVRALANALMPGRADERLVATVAADLDAQTGLDEERKTARALGLLVGSPAFQRR